MISEKSRSGHAVVIGAGVMGAGIAALLANIGWTVDLLDRVPEDAGNTDPKGRDRLSQEGLDRALKTRPPHFALPEFASRVRIGNTSDHFDRVAKADWVVEAVAEDPAIKNALMRQLATLAGPETVISSNTSALSLSSMIEGCPTDFRARFLGTHFFNPPRYMKCVELAPTTQTDPEVFEGVVRFADRVLGKRIIRAKDTPGFISTRLGMYNLVKTIELAIHHGMTIEQVDYLTGPLIGRPKSGTFRLADVVGLDITTRVADNLKAALPQDEAYQELKVPEMMRKLVASGQIGAKAAAGFYKRERTGDILSLDLISGEYRPCQAAERMDQLEDLPLPDRLTRLFSDSGFTNEALILGLDYMVWKTPEVADRIVEVDDAMMGGFGWEMGPFHSLDVLRPALIKKAPLLNIGGDQEHPIWSEQFYSNMSGKHFYFDFHAEKMQPLPRPDGVLFLKDLKKAGKTVEETDRASLVDIGDGALCLEWHTKMNVIDPDLISFIDKARQRAEKDFAALVIGGIGEHFSAGFDIKLFASKAEAGDWKAIDEMLNQFQQTLQGLKHASVPVICTTYGYTLGGGCEIMLHCQGAQAAFESAIGLPEANVGLIPAGGGTTQMCLRALAETPPGSLLEPADAYPFLKPMWDTLRQGRFSSSADEALKFGFLGETHGTTRHPDRLLHYAKERALSLAETHTPITAVPVVAPGESALARFRWELHLLRRAEQISEHDARVADHLAYILCGGGLIHASEVSEQYLLDLEREAFLSLAGMPETLARIKHTLGTGKPLRN
jgi:3-hydroxyacyl-CoA dehydrogenase